MNQPKEDYPSPQAAAGARRIKRILLALPFAFLLLLWAGNAFIRWVWQPPIVIEGQVVDTEGKGVPDVFVIVNHWFDFYNPNAPWILAEGSTYSGLTCAPYSRVLQTDNEGRYYLRLSMREAFGDQRYPSLEWRTPELKFYKPGWRDDWQNIYQLREGQTHGHYPTRWETPDPLVMQPTKEEDIKATLKRIGFIAAENCDRGVRFPGGKKPKNWQHDPSWLSLYRAQYAEIWTAWCGAPGRENFDFGDLISVVKRLDGVSHRIYAHQLGMFSGEYSLFRDRHPNQFDESHNILRQAASSYPWDPEVWYRPVDWRQSNDWYRPGTTPPFQPQEKAALCEALRFENYTMENPQP